MPYPGYYFDGESEVECEIIRMGASNSRIRLRDGSEVLKSSDTVRRADLIGNSNRNLAEMILPITPLEMLYRQLRKLKGKKRKKFESIQKLLGDRHGAKGASFLSELFRRSVAHASFYRNVDEGFCPDRKASKRGKKYARKLVQHLGEGVIVEVEGVSFSLVDFEIFPFRTTYSCTERGRPSTSTGSGGMDMLLAVKSKETIPAVGEIKADSEVVGPTFALIQSLMYASQIATPNQFERLAKQYPNDLGQLPKDAPTVEIIVILESIEKCISEDLAYAHELACSLLNDPPPQISAIRFLQCSDGEDFQWKKVESALPSKG